MLLSMSILWRNLPTPHTVHIPIHKCYLVSSTVKSAFFFFGAKTHNAQTRIEPAPSPAACAEWARTKHAAGCGPLATTDGITWTTSTRNVTTYKWPTESSNTVYHVILIKYLAIYDHARGKMSSPIGSMSSCQNRSKLLCFGHKLLHMGLHK